MIFNYFVKSEMTIKYKKQKNKLSLNLIFKNFPKIIHSVKNRIALN